MAPVAELLRNWQIPFILALAYGPPQMAGEKRTEEHRLLDALSHFFCAR